MTHQSPFLIIHRRNKISQLESLPKGCWIELDVDIYEGRAYLTHDPILGGQCLPELFELFIPVALKKGIEGFVVDCKRECVEKLVKPVFEKYGVSNYFYLNEMEVQSDIFQSMDWFHKSSIRVWKYRGASDVIRLVKDMKTVEAVYPLWVWVDCWQRGLLNDIMKAHIPLSGDEAAKLQALGIKLCICSPELYIHKYDMNYDASTLAVLYHGVLVYRQKLVAEGILGDSVCTKFPHLWTDPIECLQNAMRSSLKK